MQAPQGRYPDLSPTILVVDDDERIRRVLVTRLQNAGFATRTAEDGDAAIEMCNDEERRPDLVILDVMMPGRDGLQVCHALKESSATSSIPILLLTALDGEAERSRGLEAGADEFLSKPFNGAELLGRVRSLLGLRKLEKLVDQRATVEQLVEAGSSPVREAGATVLVVEDDRAHRLLYTAWLSDGGHLVREAESLAEANALLATHDFDLAIVDIVLPDGDGRDLVRRIREHSAISDLPILLVTSMADRRDKIAGFEAGADDFIDKPVDPAEFRARVKVHLRRRAVQVRLSERLRAAVWRAVTDSLTGAYGRSFFDAHLRQQLALSRRYQRPVSVLMMDIDHFKRINDAFGHQAGDEVIRSVSERLRRRLRLADVLCRYGGEEFAAILPETPLPAANRIAEELRALVAESAFSLRDASVSVSISIGVASSRGGTAEVLVEAADRALYRAKGLGRNRVVVGSVEPWAAPDGSPPPA